MELMELFKAALIGIVQGITEWLPVSSTGHMILFNEFIKMNVSETFMSTFLVVIQFGSILAVLTIFFKKLNPFDVSKTKIQKSETIDLWIKVIIAVIPSGILALIVYGIIMIMLENRNKKPSVNSFSEVSYKLAIGIGLFQCLALIPGTSRSGSTIIGAVLLGTSRYIATEFSFFLAVPTMLGASALKLVKTGFAFSGFEWLILATGSIVAYIVSILAIKFLLDYIKKHDFKVFGYYRIVLGILVLAYFFLIK